MNKIALAGFTLFFIFGQSKSPGWTPTAAYFQTGHESMRPVKGYVADKETAITIGRAVIKGALGRGASTEPLDAKLSGDVWIVYDYSPLKDKETGRPSLGGPIVLEISKTTGAILTFVVNQ